MSIYPNNVFRPEIFVFAETALYFETAYLHAYFPTAKCAEQINRRGINKVSIFIFIIY